MTDFIISIIELLINYKKEVSIMFSGYTGFLIVDKYEKEVTMAIEIFLNIFYAIAIVAIAIIAYKVVTTIKAKRKNKIKNMLNETDFLAEPIFAIQRKFIKYTKEPLRAMIIVMKGKKELTKELLEYEFKQFTPVNMSKAIMMYRGL